MADNGRPTIFSDELMDIICGKIADGQSVRSITREEGMPAMTTIFRWLREKESFRKQYAIAKEDSAESMFEDIIDIADHDVKDPLIDQDGKVVLDAKGKPIMVTTQVAVNHAKLRADVRKWAVSKILPKKYGDKPESFGDDGEQLPVKVEIVRTDASKPKQSSD